MTRNYPPVRLDTELRTPSFDDLIKHILEFDFQECFTYFRVSTPGQAREGDLLPQRWNVMRTLRQHGKKVIGEIVHVGTGENDVGILRAIDAVRRYGKNIPIVSQSVDRIARNDDFQNSPLNAWRLNELRASVGNAKLLTVIHPDTPYSTVKSIVTKLGQECKGRKGGRGIVAGSNREMRKNLCTPHVNEWLDAGMSCYVICRKLKNEYGVNVGETSIRNWRDRR